MKAGWYAFWASLGWQIGQGAGCLFWIVVFILVVTLIGGN